MKVTFFALLLSLATVSLRAMDSSSMLAAIFGAPGVRAMLAPLSDGMKTLIQSMRDDPDGLKRMSDDKLLETWKTFSDASESGLGSLPSDVEELFLAELRRRGLTDKDVFLHSVALSAKLNPLQLGALDSLIESVDKLRECLGDSERPSHSVPSCRGITRSVRRAPEWGSSEFSAPLARPAPTGAQAKPT